jgi:Fe2+ transport system protein B
MLVDFIVHVMFQVTLASIMFWAILIPSSKITLSDSIDRALHKPLQKLQLSEIQRAILNTYVDKDKVIQTLSAPDVTAYKNNTRVMVTSFVLLGGILITGFVSLLYMACSSTLKPIIFELFVTYTFVFIAQVIFVKKVITQYYPSGSKDLANVVGQAVDGCISA